MSFIAYMILRNSAYSSSCFPSITISAASPPGGVPRPARKTGGAGLHRRFVRLSPVGTLEGQHVLRLFIGELVAIEIGEIAFHGFHHIQILEQLRMQGLRDLFHQEETVGAVIGRSNASEVHVDPPILHRADGSPGGILRDQLDVVHPAHEDIGRIPLHNPLHRGAVVQLSILFVHQVSAGNIHEIIK